jgi:hypothetical protein
VDLEAGYGSLFIKNVCKRAYRVAAFFNFGFADVIEFDSAVVEANDELALVLIECHGRDVFPR